MQSGWIIAIVCMGVLAIADVKEKAVPSIFLMIFGVIAVIYAVLNREKEWMNILYSLIPGIFLLMVSLCTKESIGYGDGWAVAALGLLIGAEACLLTVCAGLAVSAIFSLILLALHKVNGKSRLPFLPFLMVGLGVLAIGQKGF